MEESCRDVPRKKRVRQANGGSPNSESADNPDGNPATIQSVALELKIPYAERPVEHSVVKKRKTRESGDSGTYTAKTELVEDDEIGSIVGYQANAEGNVAQFQGIIYANNFLSNGITVEQIIDNQIGIQVQPYQTAGGQLIVQPLYTGSGQGVRNEGVYTQLGTDGQATEFVVLNVIHPGTGEEVQGKYLSVGQQQQGGNGFRKRSQQN